MNRTEASGGPDSEPPVPPDAPGGDLNPPGVPSERTLARRRRRRRRRVVVLSVLGLFFVFVVGLALWYEVESHASGPLGRAVVVKVRDGESTDALVSTLGSRNVIDTTLAFKLSLLLHGSPTLNPGDYQFYGNEPFARIRSTMAGGPDVFPVDVVPGFTLHEIEEKVADVPSGALAAGFTQALKAGTVHSPFDPAGSDNLEGLVGSGVYLVVPGETGQQLLTEMVGRFNTQAAAAGLTPAAESALGMTPYQVVIVASITEKEAYLYTRYMGQISRVVYNRLAADMPLAMTSTVLYPLGQDGGTVTTADRRLNSPYNTYLNKGLPPTPIAVPSPDALRAAAQPTPGPWLYFVTVSQNGTTLFTATYQQQLANEKLAQQRGLG